MLRNGDRKVSASTPDPSLIPAFNQTAAILRTTAAASSSASSSSSSNSGGDSGSGVTDRLLISSLERGQYASCVALPQEFSTAPPFYYGGTVFERYNNQSVSRVLDGQTLIQQKNSGGGGEWPYPLSLIKYSKRLKSAERLSPDSMYLLNECSDKFDDNKWDTRFVGYLRAAYQRRRRAECMEMSVELDAALTDTHFLCGVRDLIKIVVAYTFG